MAVLSNSEIEKALDTGRLKIEPRPAPAPGQPGSPYDTISVDLRLSREIRVPKQGLNLNFDLREKGLAQTLEAVSDPDEIPETGWILRQGQFILGTTVERVGLPLVEHCLAARVEGRSSLARTGLLVHFTAPTIHPGFEGHITLEIINLGAIPLTLRPGMRLCQLIVETVEGPPVRADSQFQGQTTPTGFQ